MLRDFGREVGVLVSDEVPWGDMDYEHQSQVKSSRASLQQLESCCENEKKKV